MKVMPSLTTSTKKTVMPVKEKKSGEIEGKKAVQGRVSYNSIILNKENFLQEPITKIYLRKNKKKTELPHKVFDGKIAIKFFF